jgi:hypothetical protein
VEQEERDHRVDQEQPRGERQLVAELRKEQWNCGNHQDQEREVDPPALGDRIEAVHELVEADLDEGPARALDAIARLARIAGQTRVEDHPVQDRRDGLPQEPEA